MRRRPKPVYSTNPDTQTRCPRCGRDPCICPRSRSLPPGQQEAHIRRETKGRGGKTVTVVRNLQLTAADMKALAQQLKRACGTGGTAKEGIIEIQGDQRDQVAALLQQMGYRTKFTGG
jgi:translation initiation factor 1